MERRQFLGSIGLTAITGAAGCLSGDDTDVQDSDGDGVIDSEDYAPNDPDVQAKSDIVQTTVTPAETVVVQTPTPTPRPTPTREETVTGQIRADYRPLQGRAIGYYKSYSPSESVVEFEASELDLADDYDELSFTVAATKFEDQETVAVETMDARYVGTGRTEVTLRHDFPVEALKDDPFQFMTAVYAPDKSFTDAVNQNEADDLAYTDRLEIDRGQLTKNQHPDSKTSLDTDQYTRRSGEGAYYIEVTGQVRFGFVAYKSAYAYYQNQNPKSGVEVARNAVREGVAKTLADIIHDNAENAGRDTPRQKANYVVEAIQSLPYVSDTVDNGYNDHNKYPIETLVEAGGDCEDTAILLAALLRANPFGYGTALIYLPYDEPIHAATGVAGEDDVVGTYYEVDGTNYYYTETTGEGWKLGELPSQYEEYSADVQLV